MKRFKAPFYTEGQLEQMDEKEIKHPHSDKWLTYDEIKRQYIPTLELFIKNRIRIDEQPEYANEMLENVSDQIYTCAYKNSGSSSQSIKCIIAKGIRRGISPYRFRETIKEIMIKQGRFYERNGDLDDIPGIDAATMQSIAKGIIRLEDRNIDPKIIPMLRDLGLTWRGSYDEWIYPLSFREDW